MKIIERILETLDIQGKTMTDLCSYIDINTSTMATWKSRQTDPPTKYLIRICEFLDISSEYLLTGSDSSQTSGSVQTSVLGELSDAEIELIQNYRKADYKTQIRIGGMLEGALLASSNTQSTSSNLSSSQTGNPETPKIKVG